LVCLSLCAGLAIGFTETWNTGAGSFEASPADGDQISEGAGKIRGTRIAVRERMAVEHDFGTGGGLGDTGKHLEGSARAYIQDTTPSDTDEGRIWFSPTNHTLKFANEAAYVYAIEDWTKLCYLDNDLNITGKRAFSGTVDLRENVTLLAGKTIDGVDPSDHQSAATLDHPDNSVTEDKLADGILAKMERNTVFDVFGGDGSDGDVSLDNTNLSIAETESGLGVAIKQYDDITLANTADITVDAGVHVLVIGVKGTLTLGAGCTINMNGKGAIGGAAPAAAAGAGNPGNGGGDLYNQAVGGTGSAGGTPSNLLNLSGGGGGGAGSSGPNDAAGGGGGAAGMPGANGGAIAASGSSASDVSDRRIYIIDSVYSAANWIQTALQGYGAGGGSGASVFAASGGAGGNGGGVIFIEANTIVLDGDIQANGANGSNGATVYTGGGGGGGGGLAVLLYKVKSGAGSVTATGGSGATGTNYNGGDGGNGLAVSYDVDG